MEEFGQEEPWKIARTISQMVKIQSQESPFKVSDTIWGWNSPKHPWRWASVWQLSGEHVPQSWQPRKGTSAGTKKLQECLLQQDDPGNSWTIRHVIGRSRGGMEVLTTHVLAMSTGVANVIAWSISSNSNDQKQHTKFLPARDNHEQTSWSYAICVLFQMVSEISKISDGAYLKTWMELIWTREFAAMR